jgi:hypothetical protein
MSAQRGVLDLKVSRICEGFTAADFLDWSTPSAASLAMDALPQQVGFVVSGCGLTHLNGTYWPDAHAEQLDAYSHPYVQENGEGTIEVRLPSEPGTIVSRVQFHETPCVQFHSGDGWWWLSERYGDNDGGGYEVAHSDHYGCESNSPTPPACGWFVNTLARGGGRGKDPPPALASTTRAVPPRKPRDMSCTTGKMSRVAQSRRMLPEETLSADEVCSRLAGRTIL